MALAALACGGGRPAPTTSPDAAAIPLARGLPFAELDIPADNRPDHRAPPEWIPVGPFKLVRATGRPLWEAPMPIRSRAMFFSSAPKGMRVRVDGEGVPHKGRSEGSPISWGYDGTVLQIVMPPGSSGPPGVVELAYPKATEREAELNLAFAPDHDPATFARATIQTGPYSRTGLLLPAPGTAAWDLTVPPAAELWFGPGLVRPEVLDGPPSDGARLVLEVEAGGQAEVVWSGTVRDVDDDDAFAQVRVDLSAWSGQQVRLRARSEPAGSSDFDYVFLADPVVASRKAAPRRVILVFVDTERADHLGLYGYQRDTSPSLDAWAEGAAVFDHARSVAPWTLPTARSVVTGRQPELYSSAETLQHRLAAQGWSTAMLAGNVYLSSNFDINRDWGEHRVVNFPGAEDQVDAGLAWLDDQDGRDALLLLHFMDVHLPYREPATYRHLFAGPAPKALGEEFSRTAVLRARPDESARGWIRDRYDGNVRYVHDQLQRVFDALEPSDVVVYFADHGEELWDHGGFEHGHTLYDELLHVPLVIKAPDLPPGRVEEPVSLLDVTPTVLDLLGMPATDLDGRSLVPAIEDQPGARDALAARDLAFGRPLYGDSRWGVLHGAHKYTTTEGYEELYDLDADPHEQTDLLSAGDDAGAEPYRAALGAALGTEAPVALRLVPSIAATSPSEDLRALVRVPGGVAAAWAGDDPTAHSVAEVTFDGEYASICWLAGYRGSREVFVEPVRPMAEAVVGTSVWGQYGPVKTGDTVDGTAPTTPATATGPLVTLSLGGRSLRMGYAIAPIPPDAAEHIEGADAELTEALRAIGYAVGDEEDAATTCDLLPIPAPDPSDP